MSLPGSLAQAAGRQRERVAVMRLMLTNFRSYGGLDLKVDRRHVVLVGANGAGKTNVLEALSMFSPGRGLRGARLPDMARAAPGDNQQRPWAVSMTLADASGQSQIGVGFLPGADASPAAKRTIRVDGEPVANAAQLAERVRMIWLTPAMDRMFMDGVSERRRYFDRLIASFDPLHARLWTTFETAMRERLGALRAGGNAHWLSALERTMAEAGVALAASRLSGTATLTAAMAAQRVSPFPRADVSVSGSVERMLETVAAVDAEDQYAAQLRQCRSQDAEAGRTSAGPHLTDFIVRHHEKGRDAQSCSTGEQKALLLRLTLGCASLSAPGAPETPLLLLDEVAAHLDDYRRHALFDELEALNAQTWMTGVDAPAFAALDGRAQVLTVSDGHIRPH